MSEKDHNNSHARECQKTDKSDDDFIPDEARPLCPNCLTPCHPLQFYCCNCDSNEAINPLGSYMPFVRIRLNIGMLCKLWRKAFRDKDTSIILRVILLLLFIFGILTLAS